MKHFLRTTLLLSLFGITLFSCKRNENLDSREENVKTQLSSIDLQYALADSLMAKAKFDSSNIVLWDISEKSLKDSNYEFYLNALNKIAENYVELGKFDSMKIMLNNVINSAKIYLDSVNLQTAQAYYAYGLFFVNHNIFDSAKIYLNRALEFRKQLLEPNSPEIGDVYNGLGNIEFYTQNNQEALHFYELAKNLMINRGFYNKGVGLVYMNIGIVYDNLYQFKKARAYLDTSYQIQSTILDKNHPVLAQIEINKMSIFANSGELDSAIVAGVNAMEIISNKFGANHPYNGMIYNNLGLCYASYGDNKNALIHFEKARQLLESINSNLFNQLAKSYGSLGQLNFTLGNNEKAIEYYEKALSLMKSENNDNVSEISQFKKLLAVAYATIGEKQKALNTIEEAVNDWGNEKSAIEMQIEKTKIFHAQVLNLVGDYNKAIKVAKQGITYFDNTTNINYLFYSFSQLAEAYLNLKDYNKVIDVYKNIFKYFPTEKKDKLVNVEKIISYYELEGHILSLLNSAGKAAFELYSQTANPEYLDLSQEISEILSELFFENYEKIIIESSKFSESKRYKDQINIAIQAAYFKFKLSPDKEIFEQTLKLAEFNKSISLLESLNEKSALSKISVPKIELEKLQKIKSAINFYMRSLSSDDADQADSSEKEYYKNRLFELRNEYRNYKSVLSKKYPQLNALLKLDLNLSVDFIRNFLINKNQTAIEYYLHNKTFFVFGISQNDFFIEKLDSNYNLKSTITSLLKSIDKNEKEQFINFSNKVYNEIFSNIDTKIKTERILIIPDSEIGYIPFDALLFTNVELNSDYRDLPYLLKKYSIGYAYSLNILGKVKGGDKTIESFFGLAPFNSPFPENK